MNRALAVAVRDEDSLEPGDLDQALREGRVTITVEPAQDSDAA